jgi:hypothetical protein
MTSPKSKHKYRPVLTQIQISHIIDLCKRELSQPSISVISALAPYEYKIVNQSVKPAHTIVTRETIAHVLGFEELPESDNLPHPADLWETYLNDPSLLAVSEILEAKQWAYTNDKMSRESELEYENYLITNPQRA